MTRDATPYGSDANRCVASNNAFVRINPSGTDEPIAGFYRGKLRRGGALCGFRVWFGAPLDPVTGEEMDRSHRWQIEVNGDLDLRGELVEKFWYICKLQISEADYNRHCAKQGWAREHAPKSALADPRRKSDPINSPLYF